MVNLNYLNPEEIKKNKEEISAWLSEQGSSPVIKSGRAMEIALEYLKKEDKILDCGPGTGRFLRTLGTAGFRNLCAVDIDNYLGGGDFEFKAADLSFDKIPWEDNFFDAITAWQVIEHLENPHNFIREAHRLLKPAGLFIFSMPNVQHIFNRIFFLRKGDVPRWRAKNNHIALFPKGLFEKSFLKYFDLVEKKFTEGEFPYRFLSRFRFPSNEWFGRDVIYILRNRK
jgi:2-polyprenyl-3-methyl-5-hydroxy-6-metoxy-1,4-benzoquinol methylase